MDVLTQYSAVHSAGFKSKRRFTSLEHLNSFLQHRAFRLFYELVSVLLILREGSASPAAIKLQSSESIAVLNRLLNKSESLWPCRLLNCSYQKLSIKGNP